MSDDNSTFERGPGRSRRAAEPVFAPNPPEAAMPASGLAAASAAEPEPMARRRTRRPVGSRDQKLAWPPIPGFHVHVFNDEPGRIAQAEEAGYEHVVRDGKPASFIVGTARGGAPLVGYVMKIPQDWYEEDQAALQREIDKTDRAIRRGAVQGEVSAADQDAFYASAHGRKIQIEEGTGRASR